MAQFSRKIFLLSAFLVILSTATWVRAEEDDDEATVEVSKATFC